MWAFHKKMQDGSNWFQHFNNKLKMVDYAKLKELMEDWYKAGFFLTISTTKHDKLRKFMNEKATEAVDARITFEALERIPELHPKQVQRI